MSRSYRALGVMLVAVFGLWGCSRAPSDTVTAEKLKAVEGKLTKLEEEFRIASSARDQFRMKLSTAEQVQSTMQAQLDMLGKEMKAKEELVAQRTTERDQLNSQYEEFRKNVRDLISKAEEALAKPQGSSAAPVIPTSRTKESAEATPAVKVPSELPLPTVPTPPAK